MARIHIGVGLSLHQTLKDMINYANITHEAQEKHFGRVVFVVRPGDDINRRFFWECSNLEGVYVYSMLSREYEEVKFGGTEGPRITLEQWFQDESLLKLTVYKSRWEMMREAYLQDAVEGKNILLLFKCLAGLVEYDMQNQSNLDYFEKIVNEDFERISGLHEIDPGTFVSMLFLGLKTWIYGENFFKWGLRAPFKGVNESYEDIRMMNQAAIAAARHSRPS